jgi:hypothetical protein
MRHLPIRRLAVAVVAFGVLGSAAPAFASQPAAGTVGNAGSKTPAGQTVNDRNRGYGCDDNQGAGKGNPAFGFCSTEDLSSFAS